MRAPELFERVEAHCRNAVPLHTVELPLLGIRVVFRTGSAAVLNVIEEAFGAWSALAPADIDDVPAVIVRIAVHDERDHERRAQGPPATNALAGIVHEQMAGGGLFVDAGTSIGASDPARREAAAYVSRALLSDRNGFRYGMLEALTWALLTRLDRQPLHAAALASDDAMLLLAGRSGAGKSTLAYAAARTGIDVLTDHIVFLQSRPRIRVWTTPAPVRLLPAAAAQFSELRDVPPVPLHNGRTKVVAPAVTEVTPRAYDRCAVCVLGERRPVAEARRVPDMQLMSAMDLRAESGFSMFADSIEPVIRTLARSGGWILHPSAEAEASLPLLREMLAGLGRAAVTA